MSSEHLNPDEFFGKSLYHGTVDNWAEIHETTSHDRPLHVARNTDWPSDYAFDYAIKGYDPAEDWDAIQTAAIKKFRIRPGARVHVTEEEHWDGALSDEEQARVKGMNADITLWGRGSNALGLVYNRDAVEHVHDIKWQEHRGSSPESEMEGMYGEDWRWEVDEAQQRRDY